MKKYVRPEIIVETFIVDTNISSCKDCPTDVDCVNANNTGTYTEGGVTKFCNYGNPYSGC